MKIYIAAPWAHRDEARQRAAQAEAAGHEITHDWWDTEVADDNEVELARCAYNDLMAVRRADVLIVLNLAQSEGKAVETGMAIAWQWEYGKPWIYIVGKRSNIFHRLNVFKVWMVDTFEDVLKDLADES